MEIQKQMYIIFTASALAACGGGSDKKENQPEFGSTIFEDTSELGDPLNSGTLFELYTSKEGAWQRKTLSETFTEQKSGSTTLFLRSENESTSHHTYSIDNDSYILDFCFTPPRSLQNPGNLLLSVPSDNCDIKYYGIDESSFFMDANCQEPDARVQTTYTKISDTPIHNSATLIIESSEFANIDVTSGACSQIANVYSESYDNASRSEGSDLDSSESIYLSVFAPSGNTKIGIDFTFESLLENGHTIVAQTYTVDLIDSPSQNIEVDLVKTTEAIPGLTDFDTTRIESGTVTIDSVSDLDISGSFSLVTESGETITGSFTTDLP